MELPANKFGRHLISIGQCKHKDKSIELLILVQNWGQIRSFFSNAHICEGVSLEMELPPQVGNVIFSELSLSFPIDITADNAFRLLTASVET